MRSRRWAPWWFVVVLGVLLGSAGVARAQPAPTELPAADQAAIRAVIASQIGAFRRDDDSAAFALASPNIQHLFGDAATFMAMVRRGYAPVYRPGAVAFGPLVTTDGRIEQRVQLTGPDGAPALALYDMEREPDGSWRIDGCMLVPGESVGA